MRSTIRSAQFEGAERDALDAVTDATTARDAASAVIGTPPAPGENNDTAAAVVAASAAAAGAFGANLIFGPVAAGIATAAAALGVLALFVGASVAVMQVAGVKAGDEPYQARRKVNLYNAELALQAANLQLQIVRSILTGLRAQATSLQQAIDALVVTVRWDKSGRDHSRPVDNYKLEGWQWDRVYPDVVGDTLRLVLVPRNRDVTGNGSDTVDFPARLLRDVSESSGSESAQRVADSNGEFLLVTTSNSFYVGQNFYLASLALNSALAGTSGFARAGAGSQVQVINGEPTSFAVEVDGDALLLRAGSSGSYEATRLVATAVVDVIDDFYRDGPDTLLAMDAQDDLDELRRPVAITTSAGKVKLTVPKNPFDRKSAFLNYFQETYFHIPFLIANHLNSQQLFSDAEKWYHYIFNPMAIGGPWRYREFRDPHPAGLSLREWLANNDALDAYRNDPFNPHAIARTRITAYQKCVVMKYVDNLLDWGDSLFRQFTMESVNEATMLYVMAQDILGPRPRERGSCGEGKVNPKNYRTIRPRLSAVNNFLIELEIPSATAGVAKYTRSEESSKYVAIVDLNKTRVTRYAVQPQVRMMRMAAVGAAAGAAGAGGPMAFGGGAPGSLGEPNPAGMGGPGGQYGQYGSTIRSVEHHSRHGRAYGDEVWWQPARRRRACYGRRVNALAAFSDMAASMAGVEAMNRRREQEWQHQVETAKRELSQLESQIAAAEIRRDIAEQAQKSHDKTIDQSEEVFEYFRDKLSNLGLYTVLSNRMHSLYREAFSSALSMAKMAEQAFRAERTNVAMLDGNYWDSQTAGLLAGERLLNDLQALERQFIETNYRQLEVEQTFSLAQCAPDVLGTLRRTGAASFDTPEWFFDLTYPGQYRRRLKAVRLTIPCVTGSFTNVGAALRLKDSKCRVYDETQARFVWQNVPLRHTVAIAASKAQYDAGVFDFSFRDERYMPFEGAGAIASWELSLPNTMRVFDYSTISDVLLHLSYTADFDQQLMLAREQGAEGVLASLRGTTLPRVFSLRRDFPDVFHRLLTSAANTEVPITIEAWHFPFFIGNRPLAARKVQLSVLSKLHSVAGAKFVIGKRASADPDNETLILQAPAGQQAGDDLQQRQFDFAPSPVDQTYVGVAPGMVGDMMIKLQAPGGLARNPPVAGGGVLDSQKVLDILLQVDYRIA